MRLRNVGRGQPAANVDLDIDRDAIDAGERLAAYGGRSHGAQTTAVSGASTPRILFFHIFPGVINTLIILATLEVGLVILLESTLSFLGAGVPPPTPAWGSMVADGRDRLAVAWWISTVPGLAIMFIVMSMNIFGDWLRDVLDPRLRQLE